MLLTRLLTAAVFVVVLFYAVSFSASPWPALALFAAGMGLAGTEFCAMRWHVIDGFAHTEFPRAPIRKEHVGIGALYALSLPIYYAGELHFGFNDSRPLSLVFAWLATCMILGSAFFYRREIDLEFATHKLMNGLAGFAYIAVPGLTMFKLSQMQIAGAPKGIALYFSLAVVLMGDTGGYFFGRLFGKHKLIPKVSPKKTVEGSLGGLFTSCITGVGICLYFQLPFPWHFAAIISVMAGLAGQIGDLAESALKRAANCKDSGKLLPGHGGMLDRIDALLFGVPFSYLVFLFVT
jgi:phosphatidate cytidylyltransferase